MSVMSLAVTLKGWALWCIPADTVLFKSSFSSVSIRCMCSCICPPYCSLPTHAGAAFEYASEGRIYFAGNSGQIYMVEAAELVRLIETPSFMNLECRNTNAERKSQKPGFDALRRHV